MTDLDENQENGNSFVEGKISSVGNLSKMQCQLKERYIINYAEPLEYLDMNGGKAYRVNDRIDKERRLFALICGKETTARHSLLPYIKSIKAPNLLNLIEYGVVTEPENNTKVMALIYQQPLGGKVVDDSNRPFVNDENKTISFLSDMLTALQTLHSYGITHRAIRIDNLFYLDDTKEKIVLGDCVGGFPAYYQPSVYESVESLMAKKEGRGNGSSKEDIYSLAVTSLFLFLGKENNIDLSAPELVSLKMKKGSYTLLSGQDKIPIMLANILRGLLNDDPDLRWNISHTQNLLTNKPAKISHSTTVDTTKKAFNIGGQKYYTQRDVAFGIFQNPKEAYELYTSGKIIDWIKNGLENEELAMSLEKAIKNTADSSQNYDIVIAKICIFLAPRFPVILGSTILFPSAISKAIYFASIHDEDLNDYSKICNSDLMRLWYLNQTDVRTPGNISEIKNYVNNPSIGFGLDRIMYEFDDDIPCISKLVDNDYVCTPSRVLRVLNNNYNNSQEKPYDSNLITYLRCKMGKKLDGILTDINSKIKALEASAILRLYTTMQNKYGPQQLPKLAQWLSICSMPLIKSYHNLKYQRFLEKELIKVNKSGKLHEMLDLLENEEARKKDNTEYNIARKTVKKLLNEKHMLINNDGKWEEAARDLAMKSACFIAVIVMLISFIINLFGVLN